MSRPEAESGDAMREARRRMIFEQIHQRGVRNPRVLDAMDAIPREWFVPGHLKHAAYDDQALPIAEGQTISQPYIVAYMTAQLHVRSTDRVLEIGTGTGYQCAVLAHLAREVYSIERIESLHEAARERLARLGLGNVHLRVGDGTLGWPEAAPFDRIMITAGAPEVPPRLFDQLIDGGRLVAPLGSEDQQRIVVVERLGERLVETPLIGCRFVKLIGEAAWPAG